MVVIKDNSREVDKAMKDLDKFLRIFPDKLVSEVLKSATAKGMTPFSRNLKATIRSDANDEGHLAQSIGKKTKLYKRDYAAMSLVGPRSRMRYPSQKRMRRGKPVVKMPSKYAHLVEYGHKIMTKGANRRNMGQVRGRYVFKKAWQQSKAAVGDTYIRNLKIGGRRVMDRIKPGRRNAGMLRRLNSSAARLGI